MAALQKIDFVVCLRNEGAEDLDLHKIYSVVPYGPAASKGILRVVDESGEDYLYPAEFFAPVEVSDATAKMLRPQPERR